MKRCLVTVHLAVLAVSAASAPQANAVSSARTFDRHPALEVILKLIQNRLNVVGHVNYVAYDQGDPNDPISNDWTSQFTHEAIRSDNEAAPRSFTFDYKFEPVGKRYWARVSDEEWIERYSTVEETRYKIVGKGVVDGVPGTLVTRGNGNLFFVFIPNVGQALRFRWRHDGQWSSLARMYDVRTSASPKATPTSASIDNASRSSTSHTAAHAGQTSKASATGSASTRKLYQQALNLFAQRTSNGPNLVAAPGTASAFLRVIQRDPSGPYGAEARRMLNTLINNNTIFPDWDGHTGLSGIVQSDKRRQQVPVIPRQSQVAQRQPSSPVGARPSAAVAHSMFVSFSFAKRAYGGLGGDGSWGAAVSSTSQGAIDAAANNCQAHSTTPNACGSGGYFPVCRTDGETRWVALAINDDGTVENEADGEAIGYDNDESASPAAVANCNRSGCHAVWSAPVNCGAPVESNQGTCVALLIGDIGMISNVGYGVGRGGQTVEDAIQAAKEDMDRKGVAHDDPRKIFKTEFTGCGTVHGAIAGESNHGRPGEFIYDTVKFGQGASISEAESAAVTNCSASPNSHVGICAILESW